MPEKHYYFEPFDGYTNLITMTNDINAFFQRDKPAGFQVISVSHTNYYSPDDRSVHYSAVVACVMDIH